MGFAQGVQAGTQAAQYWSGGNKPKSNPYQAMGAIEESLTGVRKRLHPGAIRNTAAGLANQQRAIELQERKQDFIEQQAAQAQRNKEDERRWAAENKVGEELNVQAGLAEKRAEGAGEEYRKGMGEVRTQEGHEWGKSKAKQAEDFKMVQWAVANRQAGPIVEFVNRYGSPSANLRGMSWNENGEVLVFPQDENAKPGYFKNNEELMKGFVGFLDPKVEAQALKIARESAGEKRKDREQERKDYATYSKKDLTAPQLAKLRNDARKRYEKEFENVLGELKEKAPDKETWINEDVAREVEATTGGKGAAAGAQKAISEKGAGGKAYRTFQDTKTGNVMRVYPDGRREVLNSKGEILATKGGGPAKKEKAGQWDEAISEAAQAEKAEKAKVPEATKEAAKSKGSATYTDPKTGKKMKATMNADGSITTAEDDSEKKKKRPEGYGKKGYKLRSINK